MNSNPLSGKKIAIIGSSVEGLSSANFFLRKGEEITILDRRGFDELEEPTKKFIKAGRVKTILGSCYLDNLEDFDVIIRTPGFPLYNKKLQQALKKGVLLTSQTKLFFDLKRDKIIGVSGTKGKGTTASLIYQMLKATGKKVFLGGNIGNPPLSFIDELTKDSWVVLELSSFQLEDLDKSPHIAVVLNITSDHLHSDSLLSPNYHRSNKEYLKAKVNLVKFQKKSDFIVFNKDYKNSADFADKTPASRWGFSIKQILQPGSYINKGNIYLSFANSTVKICGVNEVKLLGKHNLENICASVTASFLAGATIEAVRKSVTTFRGLEHRLEFVRKLKGISFYNDSFSTNPETTIAAIKSFYNPIILICGGSEKGADFTNLGREIGKSRVKSVVLMGKTASKIKKAILDGCKSSPLCIDAPANIEAVVKTAYSLAKEGDIVLLSPACASFDMFKNYKDRGLKFKEVVKLLS